MSGIPFNTCLEIGCGTGKNTLWLTEQAKQVTAEVIDKESSLTKSFDEVYIYLKEDREMIKVYLKDISYIESLRDYVKVKTAAKQIVTYQKISYLEQKLPEGKFVRIHRSFIIPLDKVLSFTHLL